MFKPIKKRWYVGVTTGCWIWLLCKNEAGYGTSWDATVGKVRYAHVINYEKKYGPVPKGKELDHVVCDNRGCCNPDHVKPVTHKQNCQRGANGKKLTSTLVALIRKRANKGAVHLSLAKEFSVSRRTIDRVVQNVTWCVVKD